MKRFLLAGLFLLSLVARVSAQPAPTIVSTLQTTNTSTTSLQVGCAIGSSTCTGGIVAGPIIGSALGAESGYVEIQSNVPVSTTFRLYNNAGTLFWNGSAVAIGGSLSGTTNTIPLFTSSNSVGNSIMTQSGTTITVANTLNATTLGGTLSTVSQPNVTTMAALASIGTITTGVWNGTAVGVQWGGTGSNLSGTGGTSQFLRQNSVGAAVTVVRPAVADLSDNSNVALLNAVNAFTGAGITTWAAAPAGLEEINVRNTAAGTANAGVLSTGSDVTLDQTFIEAFSSTFTANGYQQPSASALVGNASGGLSIVALTASAPIKFFTGGATNLRWGINGAGDFTFGASSHIADSSGTPTINASWGTGATITGTDYAFVIVSGNPAAIGSITFGHTWTNAPACTVMGSVISPGFWVGTPTTTGMGFNTSNATIANNMTINVVCRGY